LFFIILVVCQSRHLPVQPQASWQERMQALRKSFWGLLLPILVVGGIYTGIFTPTEAAAVGTIYALVITFGVYRTLTWRDLPPILLETVETTAMIFAIMIGATLFGFVLTVLQVPQALTLLVAHVEVSRWIFFLLINILLLFLGCILETVSIVFITVPILYPIIVQLGFDPIWFNVVMQINMEMALITPPVGMNLFVLQGVSPDSRMEQIIRSVIPYVCIMAFEIVLLCFFPRIATFLPSVVK
jgi:C4-dicarboxylate transporter DctM subunit